MPDPNGNFTPDEIGQLGLRGQLGVRQLQQEDTKLKQEGQLFEKQMGKANLDEEYMKIKIKFEEKQNQIVGSLVTKLLSGQELTPGESLVFRSFMGDVKKQLLDYLPQGSAAEAADIAVGKTPSADAKLAAETTSQGNILQAGVGMMGIEQREREATANHQMQFASLYADLIPEVGAFEIPGDISDPDVFRKVLANVRDPRSRIIAKAQWAEANANRIEAQAKAKNGLNDPILTALLNNSNNAQRQLTAAIAAGANEEQIENSVKFMLSLQDAAQARMETLGFPKTDRTLPEKKGMFKRLWERIGGSVVGQPTGVSPSSGARPKTVEDFIDAEGNLKLDEEMDEGVPPPAPGAPTLPLTSANGDPLDQARQDISAAGLTPAGYRVEFIPEGGSAPTPGPVPSAPTAAPSPALPLTAPQDELTRLMSMFDPLERIQLEMRGVTSLPPDRQVFILKQLLQTKASEISGPQPISPRRSGR